MQERGRETRVSADELRALVTVIFASCGMDNCDAGLLGNSLVADLTAVRSRESAMCPTSAAGQGKRGAIKAETNRVSFTPWLPLQPKHTGDYGRRFTLSSRDYQMVFLANDRPTPMI